MMWFFGFGLVRLVWFGLVFQDRVSLYCFVARPETSSGDQAGLELTHRDLPASASRVLGLKSFAANAHHAQ